MESYLRGCRSAFLYISLYDRIGQNRGMRSAQIIEGNFRLTFFEGPDGFVCEVQDGSAGPGLQLKCGLTSLVGVLGGLRYHFAGANALCTIYKDSEVVHVDIQLGSASTERMTVSSEAYSDLLRCLGANV